MYKRQVPEGAKALQVNLAGIAGGSAVRFLAINPYGVPIESSTLAPSCYTCLLYTSRCV